MNTARSEHEWRFLIVIDNAIIAEDLREHLSMLPSSHVDLRRSLSDDWQNDYAVAFFGVSLEALWHDSRIRRMHRAGTQLVVLNGHIPSTAFEETGIVALHLPFRTEDLEILLEQIGVPARGK